MNFDLGTLSGVLGVVLTIIFFFIGYRQTIGAKKERAAVANREIVETLLRRFTLDSNFVLQFDELEKFVAGTALDNRVKVSDVYSLDEIQSLLYAGIVRSDYVAANKRKTILEKFNKSFKMAAADERVLDGAVVTQQVRHASKAFFEAKVSGEALLGVASALMAAGLSAVAGVFANGWVDRLSGPTVRLTVLMAVGVSAITAIALVAYARVRDRNTATATDPGLIPSSLRDKHQEFETKIIERLRAIGIPFTLQRDVDLIISLKGKKIAIEWKLYPYPPPPERVRQMITQLDRISSKYGCDEGYLVFDGPIPDKIRVIAPGKIRVLSVDDLFRVLTSVAPLSA